MPEEPELYADLILPLALPQYYTYSVPGEFRDEIQTGARVIVHLAKSHFYTGIVRRLHGTAPEGHTLKPILNLLDAFPLIGEQQMNFWEWIADYYMCTVGEVYRAAVPTGLKLESETTVHPVVPENSVMLSPSEDKVLDILEHSPGTTIRKIAQTMQRKNILPLIKSMVEKGVISLEENIRDHYKSRTKDYISLHPDLTGKDSLKELLDQLEKRAPKQAGILLSLIGLSGFSPSDPASCKPVSKEELLKASGASLPSLKSLAQKKIIAVEQVEISRLASSGTLPQKPAPLTEKQTKAYLHILDEFQTKGVALLHGVTSSGKTEIYIHLIDHYLRQGKQVLYLLPEIALTAQIIQRLRNVFGDKVGVYHSRFSDAERVEVYQNLCGIEKQGSTSYDIILGVRSSIFLPYKDLGLVIVDEEHENTYKQFDPAPRYNARDAAVVLAGKHGANVLLGTATPSFESYLNAMNKRYGLVELNERFLEIQLPEITVVDIREARKRKKMHSHFSQSLLDAITETLNQNEQVILFQNRRGFSPYIECDECGWIPYCKHCDVSLTYHKKHNKLRCHYCGYNISNPTVCPSCGGAAVKTRGFGTEKIKEDISILFPDATSARLDLDTTRSRRSYERIINEFEERKIDILIGTQMVSKGLDFDHVRLVGILNADNMLNFPDFRSFERSYQLIAQVSGRAGRKGTRGQVLLQTSNPEHVVIKHILNNDYHGFLQLQLRERNLFKYPPYYRLMKLTLRHKDLGLVSKAANKLAWELRKFLGDRVVGPEFPLISRLFTYNQKCILVKIDRDKQFSARRRAVQAAIDALMQTAEFKSLQVIADVDPYN